MLKSLSDLPISKTIGSNPNLPAGRLPTLQERHDNEGRPRPEKQRPKVAPAAETGLRSLRLIKNHPDMEPVGDNFGKPKPIFRAKRKRAQRVGDAMDPAAVRSMLVGARGAEQQRAGMPTLADRVRQEGVAAYGGKIAEHAKAKANQAKKP